MYKKIWTLDKEGNQILRDLSEESKNWSFEKYYNGDTLDANNYQWMEMFHSFIHDDIGCDYERYGCYIRPGDIVADIGANIGLFSYRASLRGASQIFSFEPITPTFNCLVKNKPENTYVFNMAVGDRNEKVEFKIHSNFNNIGGATFDDKWLDGREIVYTEKSYMININNVFITSKIDFMKVDIEGGEVALFNAISDENLSSLRCISCEFHKMNNDFDDFQNKFLSRCQSLGFKTFILYHGDGKLRTVNIWKE